MPLCIPGIVQAARRALETTPITIIFEIRLRIMVFSVLCPGPALRQFAGDFDLCLLDTPPLLGVRLMASLAAADYVVTPVSVGLYELAGVADLLQTIHIVRTQGFNLILDCFFDRTKRIQILCLSPCAKLTRATD